MTKKQCTKVSSKENLKTRYSKVSNIDDDILLLRPPWQMSPREILRSPIRSLSTGKSLHSQDERSSSNKRNSDHGEDGRKAIKRAEQLVNEMNKENVENRLSDRRQKNSKDSENASTTTLPSRIETHDNSCRHNGKEVQTDTETTPHTSRTTISLHSHRCQNTPKPAYADMSDSLLKVGCICTIWRNVIH